VEEKEKKIRKK